jgi:DNA-binding transcriptional LysR family regulator
VIAIGTPGRLMMDDPSAAVAACIAGQGIFQSLALGLDQHLQGGELVQILTDWSEERFPLFAYRSSRHDPPAKVRAFLDFVREISGTQIASVWSAVMAEPSPAICPS